MPEKLFRACQLILVSAENAAAIPLTQIRALKERHGNTRIILLSRNLLARDLLPILESGADGILISNETCPDILTKSLELVLVGEAILPLPFISILQNMLRNQEPKPAPHPNPIQYTERHLPPIEKLDNVILSTKEKAILRHLMHGASNKLIARELNVAEATIKAHVRNLLRKIQVSNRTQAAMWANKFLSPGVGSGIYTPGPVSDSETLQ